MEQPNKLVKDIEAKITAETVLFFDMDGTIVDSNIANFLSYKKAIKYVTKSDYDLTYNPDKRFNRSTLKNTITNLNETTYRRIIQKKEEYYEDFLPETKLNTELANILSKYSKTNKTVLVTNCREDRAVKILNHFGLTNQFDNIFFREIGDNIRVNKYENAIAKLDVSPNTIIIFENERLEMDDAIIAGVSSKNIFNF